MSSSSVITLLGVLALATACGGAATRPVSDAPSSFAAFQAREARDGVTLESEACGESCQALRQELRYAVYVGKEIYCYWDMKSAETGIDYDALAAELEASITDATDLPAYYLLLSRWAAAFHDGHVNVYPPEDYNQLKLFEAPLSVMVQAAGTDHERVLIASAEPLSGALPGDEILAVNGKPIAEAMDDLERIRSGSTPRMRRSRASLLVHAIGAQNGAQDLDLRVRRGDAELDLAVYREAKIEPPAAPATTPDTTATDSVKVMVLPGGVGYLRLDTMYAEGLEGVVTQALDRLMATKGLIIDVRRNGGGDLPPGNLVISRLADKPVTRLQRSTRLSNFILNQRPHDFLLPTTDADPGYVAWAPHVVEPDAALAYHGKPVVMLTGPRCFSACDTFAAGIRSNGLAYVIGEGTGGGTGSPLGFDLPVSGLTFRYSVVRGKTAEGDFIESHGTLPDLVVEADADTILGKADNQLDAAYAHVLAALGQASDAPATSVAASVLDRVGSAFAPDAQIEGGSRLGAELRQQTRDAVNDEYRAP
jgi:C-terminal processing protease CtpA/Prc